MLGPAVKRFTVIAAVVVTAAITFAPLASAVQTSRFGLQASGTRSKILHPAGSGTIDDSVLVYNRTASPLTLQLDVVGVKRVGSGYDLGAPGAGLAARVHLAKNRVELGPRRRQLVTLTIDTPSHLTTPLYAAVTAIVTDNGAGSGVDVQERLAVLVGVTAGDNGGGGVAGLSRDTTRAVALVLAAALVLIAAAMLWRRLRGRRPGAGV